MPLKAAEKQNFMPGAPDGIPLCQYVVGPGPTLVLLLHEARIIGQLPQPGKRLQCLKAGFRIIKQGQNLVACG